jgi:hypothetical protein
VPSLVIDASILVDALRPMAQGSPAIRGRLKEADSWFAPHTIDDHPVRRCLRRNRGGAEPPAPHPRRPSDPSIRCALPVRTHLKYGPAGARRCDGTADRHKRVLAHGRRRNRKDPRNLPIPCELMHSSPRR